MGVMKESRFQEGAKVRVLDCPEGRRRGMVSKEGVVEIRPENLSERSVLAISFSNYTFARMLYFRPDELVEVE